MKKMIIGGICIIVTLFSGVGLESFKQKDSKNQNTVVETKEEDIATNEVGNQVAIEETKEETNEEQTNKVDFLEQNENIDTTTENKQPQNVKNTDSKNEEKKLTTTNTNSDKEELKPTSNTNQKQEEQKPKVNDNKENTKQEQKTEEYIYNKDATNKLIADIDEIAKRNKDLWDANGGKLYSIEKCENLVGQNYMYPYSYAQVEGKVLNVYSVKFLVYAVDYKRNGFATETRYYIDIAKFENKK